MNEALKRAIKKYQSSDKGKRAKKKAAQKDYQEHKVSRDRAKRSWYKTDKGKAQRLKDKTKRRARLIIAESILTADIIKRDGGLCQICGEPVEMSSNYCSALYPTLDHIIPVSKGGPHTKDNVQLAHRLCNLRKWTR
jgi:5-methylcytosine-specific restriction endonuclease McrA